MTYIFFVSARKLKYSQQFFLIELNRNTNDRNDEKCTRITSQISEEKIRCQENVLRKTKSNKYNFKRKIFYAFIYQLLFAIDVGSRGMLNKFYRFYSVMSSALATAYCYSICVADAVIIVVVLPIYIPCLKIL